MEEKSAWQIFAERYEIRINENSELVSKPWKIDGRFRNLTNEESEITPEPQPFSFHELDMLLEKVAPQITLLQYKKVVRKCVKMDKDIIRDYDLFATEAFFVCNVETLFNVLQEMGLVKD